MNIVIMQRFVPIGISLPREVLIKIDSERGDIPRSKFVMRMLEKEYVRHELVKTTQSGGGLYFSNQLNLGQLSGNPKN
jgi:hypothetical protein